MGSLVTDVTPDRLQRFSVLACALAGRSVAVAPTRPGEPAWTDGVTLWLDADAPTTEQLQTLAVQTSLLAAGSLEPDIVRRLGRRDGLARRYLAVEAHRALAANATLLPPAVRGLADPAVAAASDSPASSLAMAKGREPIADPPTLFGTIRARNLLAVNKRSQKSAAAGKHVARRQHDGVLAQLGDEDDPDDGAELVDVFSSPVGGGGGLGRLWQKMLKAVRQLGQGGTPGADTATHRMRGGVRGTGAVVSTTSAPSDDGDADCGHGLKYPEWDVAHRRYRPDWCTVHEVASELTSQHTSLTVSGAYGLRRPLARLGMGLDRCHRQAQGDDIDIDAAVEAQVEVMAGSAPDEAVYLDSLRRRRDLSVLVLLDISGSAAEPGDAGQSVHEQQRAAAAALALALHDLGDRVALYGFSSQGRHAVNMTPVKQFDERVDTTTMRRLHSLQPGAYSRLGAAIRHGATVLERRAGTPRRLLVVLSDGLAYDHGYERRYGAADARRALAEARRRGSGCLCLTIGAHTDTAELEQVFGTAAHATVPRMQQLTETIGPLFHAALRGAEVRRRVQ